MVILVLFKILFYDLRPVKENCQQAKLRATSRYRKSDYRVYITQRLLQLVALRSPVPQVLLFDSVSFMQKVPFLL